MIKEAVNWQPFLCLNTIFQNEGFFIVLTQYNYSLYLDHISATDYVNMFVNYNR